MSRGRVKCRWCKWSAPLFLKVHGRPKSDYDLLAAHVEKVHADDAEAIAALEQARERAASDERAECNEDIRAGWDAFPAGVAATAAAPE